MAADKESMLSFRIYGKAPYSVCTVHGGPGARSEMTAVARELAKARGVVESLQTATTLDGQVEELKTVLESACGTAAVLIGHSWGAWLAFIVAALHPRLVKKLLLVGSGPFEEQYVSVLDATRLERLSHPEKAEWEKILKALDDPAVRGKNALLEKLGALAIKTDNYEAVEDAVSETDRIVPQWNVFRGAWADAAKWRRSGKLLALGKRVRCPVVAIHGDYDPHPAQGVQKPLSGVLKDFRFILLKECGHSPWMERRARDRFYKIIETELARSLNRNPATSNPGSRNRLE